MNRRIWFLFFSSLLFTCILLSVSSAGEKEKRKWPKTFEEKRAMQLRVPGMQPTQEELDGIAQAIVEWKSTLAILEKHPELRANRCITPAQVRRYDALKSQNPGLMVRWHERNGTPIYISGPILYSPYRTVVPMETRERAIMTGRGFIRENAALLKLEDPDSEIRLVDVSTDASGRTHVRFEQVYRGIPAWGKDIYVHLDQSGNVDLFTGRYEPTPVEINRTEPAVTEHTAVATAVADIHANGIWSSLTVQEKHLLEYNGPTAELTIYFSYETGDPSLAWYVEIRPNIVDRWRYFFDAATGEILFKYNATCFDGPAKANAKDLNNQTQTIDTYQHQGQYYLLDASRPMYNAAQSQLPNNPAGAILTLDARNTNGQSLYHVMSSSNDWNDASTVSAHYNAATSYEYFRQKHNRNSLDNRGMTIISAVHVTYNNQPMDNAYWNGKIVSYGDGQVYFKPWAGGLDLSVHEYAHAVTEHSANLEYLFESGALNESFSDIFGAMVDHADYKLGEDIVIPSKWPTGAMRDLQNPHNGGNKFGDEGWQPAHMNEYVQLTQNQDNGGVHYNSGIPNKAAYLITEALSHDKTEKIAYCALTTKLNRQSKFIDFRLAMVRCAEELYGAGSAEVQAVKNACDQVGILDGGGSKKPDDHPAVNGPDKLLMTSTDPFDPFYLWIATPPASNPNDFQALSQTEVLRRPTVADDGTIALFIDGDYQLRIIALNPANPVEIVLDNQPIWNNVALSRDKNLVAATTTLRDGTIYLFDVSGATPRGKSIALETPSDSNTPIPSLVEFADAMDFTADKEYLVYDSYNTIDIMGYTHSFWEINALHAWNETANDFADGTAFRLFPFQPEANVGNPYFAKTKPTIFVFERQSPANNTGDIMAVDTYNGTMKKIANGTYPEFTYPVYSGDDRYITFSAVATSGQYAGRYLIYSVGIESDGLTPLGSPTSYIIDATYPVWYKVGTRPVSVEATTKALEKDFILHQNFPNPFNPSTTISFELSATMHARLTVYDALGREVGTILDRVMDPGTHEVRFDAAGLPSGLYYYRLFTPFSSAGSGMILAR